MLPHVVGAALYLPAELVTRPLRKQLTLLNKSIAAANEAGINDHAEGDKPCPYSEEWADAGEGALLVPRRTKLPRGTVLGEPELPRWSKKYEFRSKVVPRPHQVASIAALIDTEHRRLREGVLSLATGQGKTAIILHSLSLINTGAILIVVPDGSLLTQWKAMAATHLEYIEGGVGQMGDGVVDVAGRGLVIGIIDTVCNPKIHAAVCGLFEHVIIDESHTICTPEGKRLFWMYPGRRVCLSATWKRRDEMHRLVELHVGPVLYEDMTVDMPIKQVTLVETGTRVWDRSRGILAQAQLTYKDRMRIGFVWTGVKRALAAKKDRNDLILYHLHRALAAGRTVLVLAPSIAQLKYLHTGIQLPEEEKCLIIGKVEMDERHAMMQGKRVVVATDILAKQGIDYPQLDCLFLCFPMAPQQAFGRIQRGVAGKREPVVVCFTDMDNPSAANQAVKFRDNVHKLGYPVRKLSSAKSEEQ